MWLSNIGIMKFYAWQFQASRADYYEYLAAVLRQTSGKKTLLDVFDEDVYRYEKQVRGILASHWSHAFQESGGDLVATFQGTVPDDDLILLRLYQSDGGGNLSQCFEDLARTVSLVDQTKETFITTCAVGLLGVLVAVTGVAMMPIYTVPKLRQAFNIPDEYLGSNALRLFSFSDYLSAYGWLFISAVLMILALVYWSLKNFSHPLRDSLDQWAIWRLYRNFHAIRFLSALSVMTQPRANTNIPLKEALLLYQDSSSVPWLRQHIARMIERLEQGFRGVDIFKTGLIDMEVLWFMEDMIETNGLELGLKKTELRVASVTIKKITKQATWARWALLLGALAVLLGVAAWHIVVVQDMKTALLAYHAGR